MLNYKFTIKENIGGRKEQQDAAGSIQTKYGFLIVVCDGMGGAKGGAIASKMAVSIILQDVANSPNPNPATALLSAITKANAEIYYRSRNDENCQGMGTTVVALMLQQDKAIIAHVGDSRIYQLRNPEMFEKRVQKIYRTNDHSKVFELVKRGIIDEEQARVSDDSNIILRALGIKPNVDVELKDNIPYLKGDRFLLCTDGICGAVPEKQLLDLLSTKANIDTVANNLINTINQIGLNSGGGHDNMTAALVECNNNSILKTKVNMKTKIILSALAGVLLLSLAGNVYLLIGKGIGRDTIYSKEEINMMQDTIYIKNQQIRELKQEIGSLSDSLKVYQEKIEAVSKIVNPRNPSSPSSSNNRGVDNRISRSTRNSIIQPQISNNQQQGTQQQQQGVNTQQQGTNNQQQGSQLQQQGTNIQQQGTNNRRQETNN